MKRDELFSDDVCRKLKSIFQIFQIFNRLADINVDNNININDN